MGRMSPLGRGMYFKVHSDMIRCKKCGCENQLGSEFCSNCSSQLVTDVFISYSRKDYVGKDGIPLKNSVISEIKTALTAAGISYWFDEDGIYSGDEFASVIARAIRNSTVFLFVSSVNSNASRWTSNEISAAMDCKKPIIPFRIDDSPYNDSVLLKIASLDYIEYKDNARAMERLIRGIRHWVPLVEEDATKIEQDKTTQRSSTITPAQRKLKKFEFTKKSAIAFGVIVASVAYHIIALWHTGNGDFSSPFYPHVLQIVLLLISAMLSTVAIFFISWKRKWLRNIVAAAIFSAGMFVPAISCEEDYMEYVGGESWEHRSLFSSWGQFDYPENIIPVSKWGKWGLVNGLTGKVVVPYTYDWMYYGDVQTGGLISVKLERREGAINREGDLIIPCRYDEVHVNMINKYGAGIVSLDNEYGLINSSGEIILPISYNYISNSVHEKAMVVSKNDRYGLVDVNGDVIIPTMYDYSHSSLYEGLLAVELNGKWGFVDRYNNVVIPFQYESVSSFVYDGKASVTPFKGASHYIDTNGRRVD